jgi:hypothetical protein
MVNPGIPLEETARRNAATQAAIDEGYPAPGVSYGNKRGALRVAGDRIGCTYREMENAWATQFERPTFQLPEGHAVKGVSALLTPSGEVISQWVKTKQEISVDDTVDAIKAAFAEYEGRHVPVPPPSHPSSELLTLIPANDWHIGLFVWGREAGENWDLTIAENVIGQAVDDLIERSPSVGHGVVLGGGDLLHSDNSENRTFRSGAALDVDGRYRKVVEVACRMSVRTVDAALSKCQHVTVRILAGNHDDHTSAAIAFFLLAWYRLDPRVTVDIDPSLFWWHRFGSVLLGATHGHTVRVKDMPAIMAVRRAEDWGATRHRYVHGFHLHHREQSPLNRPIGGVYCEVHEAPIPQDVWHFNKGYLSGRSLQSITYHRDFGEVSRMRVAIQDAARAP